MQWSINDFLTGKSAKKRRHNEMESTTEDKDSDNSNHSSDQNNDEICTKCTWYKQTLKQSLIFLGESPPDKNIHSVLNNALLGYNRATQYCSDSVIWLKYWHLSHLPCSNFIVSLTDFLGGGGTCTLK